MRRLFGFLRNRWLISLLGLLAISILIWIVGPLIAIDGWVPLKDELVRLIAILLVLLLWGGNKLRIQIKMNKANSELAKGFDQPIVEDDSVLSQSAEEVALLKERFEEALQVMKKSSGKKNVAGIYDLPWYIIIGPPGSGKTTALLNSGLRFPLEDKFGKESLRGVGGTRNCDWWFTEDAVLLDTAGRYTTQDSHKQADSAAWEGFLDLLKKYRRRRPINGAMIAISLSDLLMQNESERMQQIKAIKLRLQELNSRLGVRFPVYVLLTKCDLIAGFMEFFDDLGQEERRQVLGMSFPYEPKGGNASPASLFMNEFDALIERLNKRLLWRMQQERDPQRRAVLFSFPQQVASLRELLNGFLGDLFSENRYDEPMLLRGFYLTSGTQEGSPIDRVVGALSNTFGLNQQMIRPHEGQGRSYFVNRLMNDVIFNEAGLVGSNQRLEIRRQWVQRASYGGVVGLTALAIVVWMTSLTRNEVYIYRFKAALEEYKSSYQTNPRNVSTFDRVLNRLNGVRELTQVYSTFDDGVPILMRMGLYQGNTLTGAAREIYQGELNTLMLPAVKHRLEEHLVSERTGPDLKYEALKAYLMLGDKARRDSTFIKLWMTLDWQALYPNNPETQGQFQAHTSEMLDLGFISTELNPDIIASSRLSLKSVQLSELLYGRMKRDYAAFDENPFRLIDAMGPIGRKVFHRESGADLDDGISSLFTYEGYHNYFKDKISTISEVSSEENWVLDPNKPELSDPEVEQLQSELEALYFSDYNHSWDQLLGDVSVLPFKSLSQAADVLDTLASPNSPMRNLLQAVVKNTQLFNEGLIDKAVGKVTGGGAQGRLSRLLLPGISGVASSELSHPEKQVDEHFKQINTLLKKSENGMAPIDPLFELLSQLYGQFGSMTMGIDSGSLSAVTGGGSSDLLIRMQSETTRQPEPVKRWLQQVLINSRKVTMADARSQINAIWQAEVLPLCKKAVQNRYPFYRKSARDITLLDFGKLFGPGGLIDSFFEDNIKPFVKVSGGRWQWKPVANSSIGMSKNTLVQFRRAASFRDAYFQLGGQTPSVSFGLKPLFLDANVKVFSLNLDGQQFRYRHGPARVLKAQWPGPNSINQVRLVFQDDRNASAANTIEGPWALFRLLDQSKVDVKSRDVANATFSLKGLKTTWQLRADTVSNPFQIDQIHKFRCPNRL
ncbi:type VI secretion system membrane subunit TssM [Neptunomonas sp.]|uniref:type VI secretion system membrane subunit TssM n=1 Tax=Neptunomonas sp. TaxID=1971898 RepID=UPI0025D78E81|nr:type VI secretion system membrane subunit TssM [Neptunomonas sp.]